MNINIADFKDDVIDLWDPITAEEYKLKNGLHTNRLILLSKPKILHLSEEDEDDDGLLKPTWDTKEQVARTSTITQMDISDDDVDDDNYPQNSLIDVQGGSTVDESLKSANSDDLIGTSEERNMLMASIHEEYEQSLEVDKAKQRQREIECNDHTRREKLRETRKIRLSSEPPKDQPNITISIRHIDLGAISRRFDPDCKVMCIYDWVGSLAVSPEHFSLTQAAPISIVYPDEDAKPLSMSMLYMQTRDEPIPLAKDDEEVEFFCGRKHNDLDETLPNQNENGVSMLNNITTKPPAQLLEEDNVTSSEMEDTRELLEGLKSKRRIEADQLEEHGLTEVSRHNCVKDLLDLYKTENINKTRRPLIFKQENAVGNGVCREVYSVFWDSFTTTHCEGVSQFAFMVSPTLTLDDFVCLGQIYTHQFIQTGTVPLKISEATIQHAVKGKVSDECLLESFKMLLHEKEKDIINQALRGRQPFPKLELIDILSDYSVATLPKPGNIREILLRVSMTELISKPYICILKFREGMGEFWNGVSSEEIHALYKGCTPTTTNVVDCLYLETLTPQTDKVFRWLNRYIKNQDQRCLARFLRFCTGTNIVDTRIMVRFEVMPELAMRPTSQTCFSILTLPSNYRSYAQFYDNFDFYMHNPHLWELNDL